MFYYFSQNNSGGSFDDSLGYGIIVEADNADEANDIAESKGVYFNGCETERDCSCCGDRWYPVSDRDATDMPMIYNEKHTNCGPDVLNYKLPTPIFYKDGRVVNFKNGPTKLEQALK